MAPTPYFRFRQFTVWHDRTAMKVGTDGTLLGAWARGGRRILDIGTGTGLIALMMAQRHPEAQVTAIDIDPDAAAQAQANVDASPFAGRITVVQADVRLMGGDEAAHRWGAKHQNDAQPLFDAIVCNPPYFSESLTCPDRQRTTARHDRTLSFRELMDVASGLLSDDGQLSVVVPFDGRGRMEQEAALAGLCKVRQCAVQTTATKPPRRYLLAFARHGAPCEQTVGVLTDGTATRTPWYQALTRDFYL